MNTIKDPVLESYRVTMNSPRADLMVRDLIERFVLAKCPPDVDLVAFNGKRELVVEILQFAKSPIDIINTNLQEE